MAEITRTIQGLHEGTTYVIRVRSMNSLGVTSDWSDALVINDGIVGGGGGGGGGSTATPTNVQVFAGFKSVLISWDAPTVPIKYWKLYVTNDISITSAPSSTNFLGNINSTLFSITEYIDKDTHIRTPLDVGLTVKIFLTAVGVDNTESNYVEKQTTTNAVTGPDISANTITSNNIITENFTGWFVRGGLFQTPAAASGYWVEMDSGGLRARNLADNRLFDIDTTTGSANFAGQVSGGTINIGGNDSTSFHVDAAGNMWLGANNTGFATAPFAVNSTGNLFLRNGADFSIANTGHITVGSGGYISVDGQISVTNTSGGSTTGGKIIVTDVGGYIGTGDTGYNIRMIRNSAYGSIDFRSNTSILASMYVLSSGATQALVMGDAGTTLDFVTIGTNTLGASGSTFTAYKSSGTSGNHFEFAAQGSLLASMRKSGGLTDFRFPIDLPATTDLSDKQPIYMTTGSHQLFRYSSSKRYKENIIELDVSDTLMNLRPVSFTEKGGSSNTSYGFIAEEVALVDANLVVYNEHGQEESLQFHSFLPVLVDGYQKLYKKVQELESRLESKNERRSKRSNDR